MAYATMERQEVWVKHVGSSSIPIREMVDEHLQATIAMLKRGYDAKGRIVPADRMSYLPALEREAMNRGLTPREDGWDA
jgi:hypothetical protein